MGIELSIAYFLVACLVTVGALGLGITAAKPQQPRLGGLGVMGLALGYLFCSLVLFSVWGDLMSKWYGQWPSFTWGIVFGAPALVITAGAGLTMLIAGLVMLVSGRVPGWIVRSQERPVWSRLGVGLGIVFALVVLGGVVLKLVLRK